MVVSLLTLYAVALGSRVSSLVADLFAVFILLRETYWARSSQFFYVSRLNMILFRDGELPALKDDAC